MAQQQINIGTAANDDSGDPIRTAWDKANQNFDELYADVPAQTFKGRLSAGDGPVETLTDAQMRTGLNVSQIGAPSEVVSIPATTAATDVPLASDTVFDITASADTAIDFSNVTDGQWGRLSITQDATGGRAVTVGTAATRWDYGEVQPSRVANQTTHYWFYVDGTELVLRHDDVGIHASRSLSAAAQFRYAADVVVNIEGLDYAGDPGGTEISDFPNVKPFGEKRFKHYPTDARISLGPEPIKGDGKRVLHLSNTTDVGPAISAIGTGAGANSRVDNAKMSDTKVLHEAPSHYAILSQDAAFGVVRDLHIECNNLGRGGLLLGSESDSPDKQSYLWSVENLRVDDAVQAGIRFNSTGAGARIVNPFIRSSTDGAHGIVINSKGVTVEGGQIGANNAGGHCIYFENRQSGDVDGGSVYDFPMENVPTGGYGINIDGVTNSWVNVSVERIRANFNLSIAGTLIRFGRAKNCSLVDPIIDNPTAGGTLAEWSANSRDCTVYCTGEAASATITVDPAAIRPMIVITDRVTLSVVDTITTDPNIRIEIPMGAVGLPDGFVPIWNGVAWNFEYIINQGDESSSVVVSPTLTGRVEVRHLSRPNNCGIAFFDTVDSLCGGMGASNFEVLNGPLTGVEGTNQRTAIGADPAGLHVQSRNGTSSYLLLFYGDS